MARSRITQGMSIGNIMDMPMSKFETYTPTQQREIVSRLASAANKRLKTLQSNNIENPTTIRVEMSGGKFSVKGKSGDSLKNEFFRAKQFLGSKFSSTKEWRKFEKKIQAKYSDTEKAIDMGLAFSYFDVLQEVDPSISALREKYRIVDLIADYIKDGVKGKDIIQKTRDYLDKRYKQEQERYNSKSVRFGNRIENTQRKFKRKKKR